jgi:C-terminal processing protease CtpA/Prc
VDTLKLTLQHVMDHEVLLWKFVSRKETKDEVVKAGRFGNFKGQLIVLIDQRSSSAAEIFAKVVQLEHRGIVLGDRSAGAVMQSRQYTEAVGQETVVFYTVSVTSANLIMSDGKSLEKIGVVPDEFILPTASDLSAGADPALARALQLAGMTTNATEAGKMFPFEWPRF